MFARVQLVAQQRKSADLVEQSLGVLEVGGVEALGGPADWGEHVAGLGALTLVGTEGARPCRRAAPRAKPPVPAPAGSRPENNARGHAVHRWGRPCRLDREALDLGRALRSPGPSAVIGTQPRGPDAAAKSHTPLSEVFRRANYGRGIALLGRVEVAAAAIAQAEGMARRTLAAIVSHHKNQYVNLTHEAKPLRGRVNDDPDRGRLEASRGIVALGTVRDHDQQIHLGAQIHIVARLG